MQRRYPLKMGGVTPLPPTTGVSRDDYICELRFFFFPISNTLYFFYYFDMKWSVGVGCVSDRGCCCAPGQTLVHCLCFVRTLLASERDRGSLS